MNDKLNYHITSEIGHYIKMQQECEKYNKDNAKAIKIQNTFISMYGKLRPGENPLDTRKKHAESMEYTQQDEQQTFENNNFYKIK